MMSFENILTDMFFQLYKDYCLPQTSQGSHEPKSGLGNKNKLKILRSGILPIVSYKICDIKK